MTNEVIFLIVIAIVVIISALFALAWVFRGLAALLYAYAVFVMELPWIIILPAFIIFPPLFLAFLLGLGFIYFGEINEEGSWKTNAQMEEIRSSDK